MIFIQYLCDGCCREIKRESHNYPWPLEHNTRHFCSAKCEAFFIANSTPAAKDADNQREDLAPLA